MIKLIITDLDGTLLNGTSTGITKENTEAVKQALKRDVKVAFSSGRLFCMLEKWHKELCLTLPAISCNGAYIRDSQKVFLKESMDSSTVLDLINLFENANVSKFVYSDNRVYCTKKDLMPEISVKWKSGCIGEIPLNIVESGADIAKATKSSCQKILVWTKSVEEKEKIKALTLPFDDYADCVSAEHLNLEFGKKGVSKSTAMEFMADMLNISLQEVLAFGDGGNDIAMLKNAGIGIAMDNGTSEVKEVADFIAENKEHDGVAKSIYGYAL